MKAKPLISIIIPIYNIEAYVESCINSCLQQSYSNIEIIAVNDGSTDGTAEIIHGLALKASNLKIVQTKNNGVAVARDIGVNYASGTYLFFLDGDDYLPLDAIEIMVNRALETNADIIDGNYAFVDQNGEVKIKENYSFDIVQPEDYLILLLNRKQIYLCFKLISKDLYRGIYIPTGITLGEDAICYVQLVKNASSIAKCESVIYHYFRRNNSVTKSPKPKDLILSYRASEWIYEFLKNCFYSPGIKRELASFRLFHVIQYLQRLKITGPYRKDVRIVIKESLKMTGIYNTGLSFLNNQVILLSYVNIYMGFVFLQAYIEAKRILHNHY